jgi:hypothetical protein
MKRWILAMVAMGSMVTSAHAQDSELAATCDLPEVELLGARERCIAVAQGVESAQPQLGILIASGNPVIGTASTGGMRLGLIPRVSASVKLNAVFFEIPDILAEEAGAGIQALNDAVGIPAPALSGDVSIGLFSGLSIAPTIGGIGSVALLGSATWLPFSAFDVEGFGEDSQDLAYGVGARIGLLNESFTVPGVSLSIMYRNLDEVAFGNVCEAGIAPVLFTDPRTGQDREIQVCPGGGDAGEFSFDLTDWSGRLAVSKRFLGLGATAGVGYDQFESEIGFGFRSPESVRLADNTTVTPVFRVEDLSLESDRWSVFGDLSYTFLLATVALEGGWMQGGEALPDFENLESEFDPGEGTFFGSLGIRLGF